MQGDWNGRPSKKSSYVGEPGKHQLEVAQLLKQPSTSHLQYPFQSLCQLTSEHSDLWSVLYSELNIDGKSRQDCFLELWPFNERNSLDTHKPSL